MRNTFGNIFTLTSFGESHGEAVGGVVDGMPAGIDIDYYFIQHELDRRRPGQSSITTSRKEPDHVELITRSWNEDDFDPLSFTLDDKELIKEFEKVNLTPEFVKDFAYNLLLAKYFLDNYVIHHANGEDRVLENPWKLQYYYKKGNKAAYLKDLYEDRKAQQNEVIQFDGPPMCPSCINCLVMFSPLPL